ncbi:hypothetical protein BV20DRAFT_732944 [Pilatotrama ljubarskyi]|nr:hypothetical protein BV20DRAFT_732944 [Pilatotrama ljubarskyi]
MRSAVHAKSCPVQCSGRFLPGFVSPDPEQASLLPGLWVPLPSRESGQSGRGFSPRRGTRQLVGCHHLFPASTSVSTDQIADSVDDSRFAHPARQTPKLPSPGSGTRATEADSAIPDALYPATHARTWATPRLERENTTRLARGRLRDAAQLYLPHPRCTTVVSHRLDSSAAVHERDRRSSASFSHS